ncbi:MAG: EF-P lysine aminoacylase GenX [Leptospiraceae bacterium]|nr:MAG: EF-P lysine aminoacylase GenX [Leptospiraceae bacterium]
MNLPELKEVQVFSRFLFYVRTFFHQKGYIEVETPLLNPFATPEPYIDSFQIVSDKNYYLITSPEFNLKTLLKTYQTNLFQIAHVFRKGDESKHHKQEFLMLEWYHLNYNEFQIIEEIKELLQYLSLNINEFEKIKQFHIVSMKQLFNDYLNTNYDKESLIQIIKENRLVENKKILTLDKEDYDDLFFIVFLTLIEPKLETDSPLFIYGYPKELRAYSKINENLPEESRRFEMYWKNLEIANGYCEIIDQKEQINQFKKEYEKRKKLNKPIFPISQSFLNSFPLPDCAGVSIGLERLYMAFRNINDITKISFSGKFY